MNTTGSTTQNRPPDLLIIPQARATIPNENLTPVEQNLVLEAWQTFGNTPSQSNTQATWKVAVCHIRNATPHITATLTLPRQIVQPAPHPATHAGNAASTPTSNAPQSA